MVHELVPTISVLAAPPSYQYFFADSYGSASLLFISTCFQLKICPLAWKQHVLVVPYIAEFEVLKFLP